MAYVDMAERSGLGNWFRMPRLAERIIKRAIVTQPVEPTIPEAIATGLVIQKREALWPSIVTALKPAIMPAIKPTIRPTVVTKAITEAEAAATRYRIERERAAREAEAAELRDRFEVIPPPVKPILVRPPARFRDDVFARKKFIASRKTPSGATHESTTVTVLPGSDPTASKFTGAGAPLTGQTVSLKESDPIVPVMPSKDGISLVDVAAPEVPSTFIEAAAVAPSPFLKYGLLALGAYIMYDSFVKSKPKRRRRRR